MTISAPPQGSRIGIVTERGHEKIVAPHPKGSMLRFFVVAFLSVWLCGWGVGLISVGYVLVRTATAGETPVETAVEGPETSPEAADGEEGLPAAGSLFLAVWLTFWTIGGLFAARILYRLVRPGIPETFLLTAPTLVHDTGIAPIRFAMNYHAQLQQWSQLWKRRKRTEFTSEQVRTLRLRETDSGNRLTIDAGHERMDLGSTLTEIEREWLFAFLATRYQLPEASPSSRS